MNITEDAKQRVEWINKRVELTDQQKEYVEFQIKEAVMNAQGLALTDTNEVNLADKCSCNIKYYHRSLAERGTGDCGACEKSFIN